MLQAFRVRLRAVHAVDRDWLVRQYAFRFLEDLMTRSGQVLTYRDLQRGFEFEGEQIGLAGMPGIWKPRALDLPISIRTGWKDPYGDEIDDDGFLAYRYFKQDPTHPHNRGLRQCMQETRPLIYLQAVDEGRYVAVWPMYLTNDDPGSLTFTAACADPGGFGTGDGRAVPEPLARRYAARIAMTRLHQGKFRERVLSAYRRSCTVCSLRHDRLLDAAHILSDRHERGDPVISNGMAMCKIHHAAFDTNILGIRPDHVVEIRSDILEERDGPMLRHGLQELHGSQLLVLPKRSEQQPDRASLEERYEEFRAAG